MPKEPKETNYHVARRLATQFELGNRESVANELSELPACRAANISLLLASWLSPEEIGTLRILLNEHIN